MASGLAVVGPEDRSAVVHALDHRGNREAFIIQVWHLSGQLKHSLDCKLPVALIRRTDVRPLHVSSHTAHRSFVSRSNWRSIMPAKPLAMVATRVNPPSSSSNPHSFCPIRT